MVMCATPCVIQGPHLLHKTSKPNKRFQDHDTMSLSGSVPYCIPLHLLLCTCATSTPSILAPASWFGISDSST